MTIVLLAMSDALIVGKFAREAGKRACETPNALGGMNNASIFNPLHGFYACLVWVKYVLA